MRDKVVISSDAMACAGVLQRVLDAQRLDVHDIEGVKVLLDRLLAQEYSVQSDSQRAPLSAEHAGSTVDASEPQQSSELLAAPIEHREALDSLLKLDRAAAYRVLQHYLTAATAKDLSIMITLRKEPLPCCLAVPGPELNRLLIDTADPQEIAQKCSDGSGRIRSKIALVDLDLKPLAKVDEHWRLDEAIMQTILTLES